MRQNGGVLLDLSEFMHTPLRTGIQRVCYELICHWEAAVPLILVRVTPDGRLTLLPDETRAAMMTFFQTEGSESEAARERLRVYGGDGGREVRADDYWRYQALLNPELFYAPWRVAFYEKLLEQMRERIFFIIYDFLPWFRPQLFYQGAPLDTMGYFRLVRDLQHLSFISAATQEDFLHRVARKPRATGPVLMLGSDGLGMARPNFKPHHRRFTVVSTLEPRKNHAAVLDAFETLWAEGVDAELTFVGRRGELDEPVERQLQRLEREEPRFKCLEQVDDSTLRRLILSSRATIFPSLAEGFGVPPLESLALGVPVIVSAGLPSIAMIDKPGQIRLPQPNAANIRQAVLDMLGDPFAERKYDEIQGLRLPTWADLSRQLGDWIESNS
jgi:glycosyltransferase involved in cell wall biosynthesis